MLHKSFSISNRWLIGGFVFFLLIVGGSQFYDWHIRQTLEEEVEQTKQSVAALKNKKVVITEQEMTEISTPVSASTETTPEIQDAGTPPHETSASAEIESLPLGAEDDLLLSKTNGSTLPSDSAEETDQELPADWLWDLHTRLNAAYPEIMELPTLSVDEYIKRYPTQEDRDRLRELSQKMVDEFLDEVRLFFASIPEDVYERAIEDVRGQLSKNWGSAVADDVMNDLQRAIE